jgi:hypothetical protein
MILSIIAIKITMGCLEFKRNHSRIVQQP